MSEFGYRLALTDWLACACAGADQRAAVAMRTTADGLLGDVAFAATAGHVLDFDDTFSEGVAHLSAACAPAALVLAAQLGLSLDAALNAYAEGFEATAVLAAATHPALYDDGWHPTAVCGSPGAAVVASRLLELMPAQREHAIELAVLRAAGMRGAFGSDGKSIQVGMAVASGVQAALLAKAGAAAGPRALRGPLGFEGVFGVGWPQQALEQARAGTTPRAIDRNWIKLHPSCLGTHAPIDGATELRECGYRLDREQLEVAVHPVARQAAHLDTVDDGLSAKFSIPYCVAHTLLHGPPGVRDFAAADPAVSDISRLVTVTVDEALPQFGTSFEAGGVEVARVPCPRGAPERPASSADLASKVTELAGDRLTGVLDDLSAPAAGALKAAGLRGSEPGAGPPGGEAT